MSGKYRWMSLTEAVCELQEREPVWLYHLEQLHVGTWSCGYRGVQTCEDTGYYFGNELMHDPHTRICRAMVPEAPHLSEEKHGE